MTPVGELPIGARFRWQGHVYRVTSHGPSITEAGSLLLVRDFDVEPLGPKTLDEALEELGTTAVVFDDEIQVHNGSSVIFGNAYAYVFWCISSRNIRRRKCLPAEASAEELERHSAALLRVAKAARILEEVGK